VLTHATAKKCWVMHKCWLLLMRWVMLVTELRLCQHWTQSSTQCHGVGGWEKKQLWSQYGGASWVVLAPKCTLNADVCLPRSQPVCLQISKSTPPASRGYMRADAKGQRRMIRIPWIFFTGNKRAAYYICTYVIFKNSTFLRLPYAPICSQR
jgi:hypothetical protein